MPFDIEPLDIDPIPDLCFAVFGLACALDMDVLDIELLDMAPLDVEPLDIEPLDIAPDA